MTVVPEEHALATIESSPIDMRIDPSALIEAATRQAKALIAIIEQRRLYRTIGKKRHVYVEGWMTLGALNGLQAYTEIVAWDEESGTARATVSARRVADGQPVARATGLCSRAEERWRTRDRYAIESMAQTRATSKVFRQALAWVMVLAGYEATPAEEMGGVKAPTYEAASMDDEQWALVRERITTADGKPNEVSKSEAVLAFMEDHAFANWLDFKARGGAVVAEFLAVASAGFDAAVPDA
jgi:hypothetical protein